MALALEGFFVERFGCLSLDVAIFNELLCHLHQPGGSRLCQHSLQAARRLGFRAMQFNLVVSTNTAGIRCWQRNGFQVVGTLPKAFRHRQLGYVDALVMFQALVEGPKP
ncbi:MAG: N-acetyltransferase family protein [Cyanobium sp.]